MLAWAAGLVAVAGVLSVSVAAYAAPDDAALERRFEAVRQADPGFAEADYNLAVLAERQGKREQARERAEKTKAKREAKAQAKAAAKAAKERAEEIIPYLRELGYPLQRARRGVELTAHIPDAPIEERMRAALRGLAPKALRISPDGASAPA